MPRCERRPARARQSAAPPPSRRLGGGALAAEGGKGRAAPEGNGAVDNSYNKTRKFLFAKCAKPLELGTQKLYTVSNALV